jgi:hypothetical protein
MNQLAVSKSETERFLLLREVAELYDPKVWPWAYDTWQSLKGKYFPGNLEVGPIEWGLTEWGGCLGYFTPEVNKITLHKSLLDPCSRAWGYRGLLGERMTEDVMLHEMLHQKIFQELGYCADKFGCHNFEPWCDEINRLNPLLGLEGKATVSRQRRIKEPEKKGNGKVKWMPTGDGTMTLKQLATWPHSLRPEGYYEESCREMLENMMKAKRENDQ